MDGKLEVAIRTSDSLSGMGCAKTVSKTGLFFFLGAGSLDSRDPLPTDALAASVVICPPAAAFIYAEATAIFPDGDVQC